MDPIDLKTTLEEVKIEVASDQDLSEKDKKALLETIKKCEENPNDLNLQNVCALLTQLSLNDDAISGYNDYVADVLEDENDEITEIVDEQIQESTNAASFLEEESKKFEDLVNSAGTTNVGLATNLPNPAV